MAATSELNDEMGDSSCASAANYKADAKLKLKAWRKIVVDWRNLYPDHEFSSEDSIDIMELMTIDIGKLYLKYEADANPIYGYIPIMASSSYGQLGALNAESVCERMFSCAGNVMDEGNSLLSSKHLEMLTVLRINRKFMEFMRMHYNDKSRDAFQMTVVKLPSEASTSTPSTPSCSDTTLSDMWASPTNATEPPLEVEAVPEGPQEAGIS